MEQFGGSPHTEYKRVFTAFLQASSRTESSEKKSATEKKDGCEFGITVFQLLFFLN